jgi:hypothetical protein
MANKTKTSADAPILFGSHGPTNVKNGAKKGRREVRVFGCLKKEKSLVDCGCLTVTDSDESYGAALRTVTSRAATLV